MYFIYEGRYSGISIKGRSDEMDLRVRSGFTLIEMLVAIGLTLVLMGAVLTFWSNLTLSRNRLSDNLELQRGVRIFYSNLENDLVCSLVGYGEYGAGIAGNQHGIRLLTRGIDLQGSAGGFSGKVISDLQQVEYRFNTGTGLLDARRSVVGGDSSSSSSSNSGEWFTLAENVGEVRFRYHDGSGWSDDFDSWKKGRLPAAIEVAVWLKRLDVADENEIGADTGAGEGEWGEAADVVGDIYDPFMDDNGTDDITRFPPDRVRVIVVPDGPEYEYGRSFEDVDEFAISDEEEGDSGR